MSLLKEFVISIRVIGFNTLLCYTKPNSVCIGLKEPTLLKLNRSVIPIKREEERNLTEVIMSSTKERQNCSPLELILHT